MRTIRTKVYKFDELNEDAKKKAIEKLYDINVDYDWYEPIYEGAKEIGLKITGFDLGRGYDCTGEFTLSASEVAANIIRDYGEECDTYKTASNFLAEWEPVFAEYMNTEEGEEKLIEIETSFLTSLLQDYLKTLREEYEYQTSKEAIIETIQANEYEFTKDGRLI